MLSENIKKYRKAQRLSQEDLAMQLHVVRQTLSKWENALSVPDADQLIALAHALGVSVNELLGTETKAPDDPDSIAAELAEANAQIAQYAEEKRLRTEAGKLRGLILWLTVIAIVIMHIVRNEVLAILLSFILLIAALVILYRNVSLLSEGFHETGKSGSIKAVTVFDIALAALTAVFAVLVKIGAIRFGENQEKLLAAALVTVVMMFTGIVAPRLPYNRHTGLRLPWTVRNEGAWNVAHRVLGMISIPLGLAYMSLTFFVSSMETLTLITAAIWIGIPGLVSLLYIYNGRRKK